MKNRDQFVLNLKKLHLVIIITSYFRNSFELVSKLIEYTELR
jgi:hypothetical protein